MPDPVLFKPICQERVWGGRRLERALGRVLPEGRPIGESWEIVDRPEAQSVVSVGGREGETLRDALLGNSADWMGPGYDPSRPFPILVKWLDCRERLSLQVHPPASVAGELNGEPKTENWYIAEAEPDAALIVGLRRGVTRAAFEEALRRQTLESCVHRFPVRQGQSILVRSGQVHAIDAGSLILEIQQNSDTTYRVYDWGRLGLDGKPRQLHVEESLSSIDFADIEPQPLPGAVENRVLAECPEFRIRQIVIAPGSDLEIGAGEQPRLLHLVEGSLRSDSGVDLRRGDNALLPYSHSFRFEPVDGGAVVLVTEGFV